MALLSAPAVSVLASLPFAQHRSPAHPESPSLMAPSFQPFTAKQSPGSASSPSPVLSPSSARPPHKYQKIRQGRKQQPEVQADDERDDVAAVPMPSPAPSPVSAKQMLSPGKGVSAAAGAGTSAGKSARVAEREASGIPRYTPLKGKRPLEREWRGAGISPSPLSGYRRGVLRG